MNSAKTVGRSDSSKKIRQEIKQTHVIVPDLNNLVPISRYTDLAKLLYNLAVESFNRNNYIGAYVDFNKFIILTVKISRHKSSSDRSSKWYQDYSKWLEPAVNNSFLCLEKIVTIMDAEEDANIRMKQDLALIDEFDGDTTTEGGFVAATNEAGYYGDVSVDGIANDYYQGTEETIIGDTDSVDTDSICEAKVVDKFAILRLDYDKPTGSANVDRAYIVPRIEIDANQEYKQNTSSPSVVSIPQVITGVVVPSTNTSVSSQVRVGANDIAILRHLQDYTKFPLPIPHNRMVQINVGKSAYLFDQLDFHASYSNFLQKLPSELQIDKSAIEVNRCFFLHLGIAIGIHPFALQTAFRIYAEQELKNLDSSESWKGDLISPMLQYAGFVDANALSFMWPEEFIDLKICFISGDLSDPILVCFFPKDYATTGRKYKDLFIRCNGSHFMLWKPRTNVQIMNKILIDAKVAKKTMQINEVTALPNRSIHKTLQQILQ